MRALRTRNAELEQELWRCQYRLRELLETAPTGIALVDPTGAIVEINSIAADILGESAESIIGRDFRSFIYADDLDRALEEFGLRLSGDLKRRETEMQIVRSTGERRVLRIRSSTLLDEGGVAGVYFAACDITDDQARELQLLRAERAASIAPLLGGVCHELNNPLTSIKSFTELLLLDERPADDREALEIVKREAIRAANIVSDLRLVARQTQDDGTSMARVDLNEAVRGAFQTIRHEVEGGDIQVRMELAPTLRPIAGVRQQLERAIEQLLTNAAHALRVIERDRMITVRTYPIELGAALHVEDTGPGIPPGDLDRIFDPFWTTRDTGEGTGLGLSLVHGIVSDHQGHVRVDGGWGTGAIFTIELPAADDLVIEREPVVQAPARTSLRILVIDDEGPIRYSLSRYMSRRGHSVVEAEEGRRGLEILDSNGGSPFDIIVADLRMPGIGGDELYERLKTRGDGMDQRLIFMTGDAESPDMAKVLEEAGVPVVLKPFELAEIAQIIETQAGMLG